MADNNINLEKEKQFEKVDGLIEKKESKNERVHEMPKTGENELVEKIAEKCEVSQYKEKGDGGELGGIVAASRQRKSSQARMKRIESVLEKGLDDIYLAMPAENREKFKQEGKKTVAEINDLLERGKVMVKEIITLIRKWLAGIPGVNRFFIEQEAKIKADEIVNSDFK